MNGTECVTSYLAEFHKQSVDETPDRKHHLAIMDDCLMHSKRKENLKHVTALLKALIRNGLKISPKKFMLFRTQLAYMGHTLMVKDKTHCIILLKSRIEANSKLNAPISAEHCKQLCGMVNFLSFFLKDLQKVMIPIYDLTRKKKEFSWGEEHQNTFEKIKMLITKAPVLVMPNNTGTFLLFSDTSKIACGSALYQEQKGKHRLVAYYSKKLPDAASRYRCSELELCGLVANISAFRHLLRYTNLLYMLTTEHWSTFCYVRQCSLVCAYLLELSRGIVSCFVIVYIGCTAIHNAHLQVP